MENVKPSTWNLFVDGSAGDTSSGAGVVLISPEGYKLNSTVRFGFKATNNVAEYEALLAGLRLAKEMQVKRLLISSDSRLFVSQVNRNFSVRDKTMASYLKMVMYLVPSFEKFELIQIPRVENAHADALSKLASSKDFELLTIVPIEHLLIPSTEAPNVMWIVGTPTWMQPIVAYLKNQVLPANKQEAYKLRRRSTHFLFIDDILYKRSFSSPLLRCVGGEEATYSLREIHEGVCGNHSGCLSLVQKILRQEYYWPTLKKDVLQFWGIDLIGPLPKGREGVSFAIIAIDYFTKWVEVEPLVKITKANTSKFLWKNIICWFGIPYSIVSDNGKPFDNKKVRSLCEELGINKHFSIPHHPQANGQVGAVNKTIKHVMKRKFDMSKGAWVDELPQVLWAIRTTTKTPRRENTFPHGIRNESNEPC
ncbi:uncharacterized protein LOC111369165 [Olea europaea var. sylvestris]|uniref:uncharacterized protein LOC111369165 n=1 Tax=Olea europaea var. sylvestris TaxID=158386 RepID=UPI000C1D8780|nr:uncharacterized protein LOC111369165 [Olea europaea var. sylvestris]